MKDKEKSSREGKLALIFWMLIWQGIGLISIPFAWVSPFLLVPRLDPMYRYAKYVFGIDPFVVLGLTIGGWVFFAKNKYQYSLIAALSTTFWDMLVWVLIAR